MAVPFDVRREQLKSRVQFLTEDVQRRDASIKLCIPSTTQTCGRSSTLAPNPWVALGGKKCYGHDTVEATEGAFCGYWSSPHNVYAATSDEAAELLSVDGGPYCFSEQGVPLACAVTADRTHRAGVYELRERARLGHELSCRG